MNPRRFRLALPVLCLLIATGCGSRRAAPPIFTDGTAVTVVDDTAGIPRPEEQDFLRLSHHVDNFLLRQARLGLDPAPAPPALDVNRFGRVPDSSWYANRTAALDAGQVGQGPGGDDPGPEAFRPWEVTGLKVGGRNPGFNFRDSRGVGYICKFDKAGAPVIATAAGAVACRLLWAAGYHVPDDRVVHFDPSELLIAEDAKVKNELGHKRPLTRDDIEEMLAVLPQASHGDSVRALVSRFLDGRPIGGFAYDGTRADDPNDTIPHERRRSLRGLRVFGAWLQHVDQKIDNTLDLYVGESGAGHVRHYLVDFDGCLGGYWAARHEKRIGYVHDIDLGEVFSGVPTLGLLKRPYEDLGAPDHPHVGLFTADRYDPADWAPNYVNDYLHACNPADAFWAGTVLACIDDDMIDAAVDAARFPDPAAAEVLARALRERRDLTVDWALRRVSPVVALDDIHDHGTVIQISAHDALGLQDRTSDLSWRADVLDVEGEMLHTLRMLPLDLITQVPKPAVADRDYLVVRWTATDKDGRDLPPSEGHYRRGEDGWRLVGVLRDGE